MSNDREVIQTLRRSSGFRGIITFLNMIDANEQVSFSDVWHSFRRTIGRLNEVATVVSAVLGKTSPSISSGTIVADINQAETDLSSGTDPNGGGTTSQAVSDFRNAVGNTTSPTYSGDDQNDPLANLLKFCIDQKL